MVEFYESKASASGSYNSILGVEFWNIILCVINLSSGYFVWLIFFSFAIIDFSTSDRK